MDKRRDVTPWRNVKPTSGCTRSPWWPSWWGPGQQNIRLYERRGLLTPDRTAGGTRQYSETDLVVLRRISELLEEGLNLAGVAKVLELEAANARLRAGAETTRAR